MFFLAGAFLILCGIYLAKRLRIIGNTLVSKADRKLVDTTKKAYNSLTGSDNERVDRPRATSRVLMQGGRTDIHH